MKPINQLLKPALTVILLSFVVISCGTRAETPNKPAIQIESSPALQVDIIVVQGAVSSAFITNS